MAYQSPIALGTVEQSPRDVALGAFSAGPLESVVVPNTSNCSSGTNQVAVVPNLGSGSFGAAELITLNGATMYPVGVATGKFGGTGDTAVDLVAVRCASLNPPGNDGLVTLVTGNGAGGFGAQTDVTVGKFPQGVATGDLNGDGLEDVVALNANGDTDNPTSVTVSALLQQPDGGFGSAISSAVTDIAGTGTPMEVAVGQVTGGAALDVVVATTKPSASAPSPVYVLEGNGNGTFDTPAGPAATLTGEPTGLTVAQLDGTGPEDVAVSLQAPSEVAVMLSTGSGLAPPELYAAGIAPQDVTAGELSGDETLDLAIADSGGFGTAVVLAGNGDGTFGVPQAFFAFSSPRAIASGNLDNDGGTDLATANASARGAALLASPAIATGPDSMQFGFAHVGTTSAPQQITVENTGNADLAVTGVTFGGNNPTEFTVLQNGCQGIAIPPGGTCPVLVGFAPNRIGLANGQVRIASNGGPVQVTHVHGIGVPPAPPPPPAAAITLSPSPTVNFPATRQGARNTATVTVRNTGGSNALISRIALAANPGNQFAVATDECSNRTLAPNASCSVQVRFTASQTGRQIGALQVFDDAPGSPQGVFLSAEGLPPASSATITRGTATLNRRGRLAIPVRCVRPAGTRCRGRLTLAPRATRLRPRQLASASFSIPRNRTQNVTLRPGRTARALIRRFPLGLPTTATLRVDQVGTAPTTTRRTVTVFP